MWTPSELARFDTCEPLCYLMNALCSRHLTHTCLSAWEVGCAQASARTAMESLCIHIGYISVLEYIKRNFMAVCWVDICIRELVSTSMNISASMNVSTSMNIWTC